MNKLLNNDEMHELIEGLVEDYDQYKVYALFALFEQITQLVNRNDISGIEALCTEGQAQVFAKSFNSTNGLEKLEDRIFDAWRKTTFTGRAAEDARFFLETPPATAGITENENFTAETRKFADDLLKAGGKEHLALSTHFVSEMQKAANGRICTDERMIALYPIFREINTEQERMKKEAQEIEREESQNKELQNEEPEVLDLSSQPENLNILANHLSSVLKNPDCPEPIYNCLSENLTQIPFDTDSPEWILGNLKMQKEGRR